MKAFDELKDILYRVRVVVSREEAVRIINHHGKASRLAEIEESLYDHVYEKAEEVLFRHQVIPGGLHRAAHRLRETKNALNRAMESVMSLKDDLNKAVDGAVAEMGKAADFIRNHPASVSDPELRALADRLTAASTALSGVDVEQVAADPNAPGTSG